MPRTDTHDQIERYTNTERDTDLQESSLILLRPHTSRQCTIGTALPARIGLPHRHAQLSRRTRVHLKDYLLTRPLQRQPHILVVRPNCRIRRLNPRRCRAICRKRCARGGQGCVRRSADE